MRPRIKDGGVVRTCQYTIKNKNKQKIIEASVELTPRVTTLVKYNHKPLSFMAMITQFKKFRVADPYSFHPDPDPDPAS